MAETTASERRWEGGGVLRAADAAWVIVVGALLSLGLIALGLVGSTLEEYPGNPYLGPFEGSIVGLVGAIVGIAYWRISGRLRLSRGTLRLDDAGLSCDRTLLARQGAIAHARLRDEVSHATVHLDLKRGRPVSLRLPNVEAAEDLVRALAGTGTTWARELRALSPIRAWSPPKRAGLAAAIVTVPIALGAWLNVTGHSNVAPWVLALGGGADIVLFFLLFQTSTRVRVGGEGLVTRWLGRERYHTFASIESIDLANAAGAHVVELATKRRPPVAFAFVFDHDAHRFRDALEQARSTNAALRNLPELGALRRPGWSLRQWVVSLRGVGAGANADHRNAPVTRDLLLHIVEDPTSAPLDRVAAAAALAQSGSTEELERARAAASSMASPKLRVALDWVTDPETSDDEVSEILAEIEADAELAMTG